jgi:hypothetical protein
MSEHRHSKHRKDPPRPDSDGKADRSARHASKKPRLSNRDDDPDPVDLRRSDWRQWIEEETEEDTDDGGAGGVDAGGVDAEDADAGSVDAEDADRGPS